MLASNLKVFFIEKKRKILIKKRTRNFKKRFWKIKKQEMRPKKLISFADA